MMALNPKFWFLTPAVILMVTVGRVFAGPMVIVEDARWEGEVRLEEGATLNPGASLTIAPGARIILGKESEFIIEGNLVAEGTADAPIIVASTDPGKKGAAFQRIRFISSKTDNRLVNCRIDGGQEGVVVTGSTLFLKDTMIQAAGDALRFENNARGKGEGLTLSGDKGLILHLGVLGEFSDLTVEAATVGVAVSGGSGIRLSNSRIKAGATGIFLERMESGFIESSEIENCRQGLVGVSVGGGVTLKGNIIKECGEGLVLVSFSSPLVKDNWIVKNQTGLTAATFSNPRVIDNEIVGNEVGLFVTKKSIPVIETNAITGNEVGISLDLSSYPPIHFNTIVDNRSAIRLEQYQSADWELRVGSGGLTRQEAGRLKSRRISPPGAEVQKSEPSPRVPQNNFLDGWVDARWNWWGEETTTEMRSKGSRADISVIDDSFDRPKVTYEGYEGSYILDRVEYAPFLDEPW